MVGLYLIFVLIVYLMGVNTGLVAWFNELLQTDLSGGALFFIGLSFSILLSLLVAD